MTNSTARVSEFQDTRNSLMVKDFVAMKLREEILSGRLRSGDAIIEGKWAEKLNVAQASIREAINTLTSEGFLEKGSGRSARVTQLTDQDAAQIYQVRAVLEGLAARLVAEKNEDLDDLEQALADMKSAAERGNIRAFYERDARFHMLLCEKSGNRFIVQELRRLLAPLFAFVLMRVHGSINDPARLTRSADRHLLILAALKSGDPDFAETSIRAMIGEFRSATDELIQMEREAESAQQPASADQA